MYAPRVAGADKHGRRLNKAAIAKESLMKKMSKVLGIVAFLAAIGFGFTGCDTGSGAGFAPGTPTITPLEAAVAAATALAEFADARLPDGVSDAIENASDAFAVLAEALPTASGADIRAVVTAMHQLTPPSGLNPDGLGAFVGAFGTLIAGDAAPVGAIFTAGATALAGSPTEGELEALEDLLDEGGPFNILHVALDHLAIYLGVPCPGFVCDYCKDTDCSECS